MAEMGGKLSSADFRTFLVSSAFRFCRVAFADGGFEVR